MNVNQRIMLTKLRQSAPDHYVKLGSARPGARHLECSCGWRYGINARNALARASQIYGAEVQHLKTVVGVDKHPVV